MNRPVLIVDGHCGVCARAADLLVRLDRHDRLEIRASQEPGVRARYGLSPQEAARTVWLMRPAPSAAPRAQEAQAVLGALDVVLGTRLLQPLASAPLLGSLLRRAYRWVAANRRRLPGATPWCERQPGRCQTPGHSEA